MTRDTQPLARPNALDPTMSSASSYKKLKKLGKGSFGSVYLVQPNAGGEPLVMKEVSLRGLSRKDRQATINEVSILKKVVHPNVIAYRDHFMSADMLCICMEHAPGGDLTALISSKRRSGERFAEGVVLRMAYELTSALSYFHHDLHLLHRDLKPQNVFVASDGSMKLGDFGLSKQLAATNALAKTLCGTPLYMSPEICAGETYNRAADVWALGCVLFEVRGRVRLRAGARVRAPCPDPSPDPDPTLALALTLTLALALTLALTLSLALALALALALGLTLALTLTPTR